MKICLLGFILPVSSLCKFSYHLFWRFSSLFDQMIFTIGFITNLILKCIFFSLITLHCWFIYHFLWRKILWSLITCLSLSDLSLIGFSDVFLFAFPYWFIFQFIWRKILWSLITYLSLSDLSLDLSSDVFIMLLLTL